MSDRVKTNGPARPRGKKGARKPPPRWRRYLVQAELELPTPHGGTDFDANGDSVELDDGARVWPWWQTRLTVYGLVSLCVVLALVAAVSLHRAANDRAAAAAATRTASTLTLRAVNSERVLRIAPNPTSWSHGYDAAIAWPEPPQLLELRIPVAATGRFRTFGLVVDKVDHGRVLVLERLMPDSNRDIRLALNSTAFGPGEYRLRVQGYTWRGQPLDVGWIRWLVREPTQR